MFAFLITVGVFILGYSFTYFAVRKLSFAEVVIMVVGMIMMIFSGGIITYLALKLSL